MHNKIYIVSLSPSIDYILKFNNFIKNKTNRPTDQYMYAAGKAIHISMLLNRLNIDNELLVFTNGSFETFFYNDLKKENIKYKQFKANGDIRINLKIIDDSQTESSSYAPEINISELDKLKTYLNEVLKKDDVLILTGSLPVNTDTNIYAQLVELANLKKTYSVVDSFKEPLLKAVDKKPFLIKPNKDELELTFNKELKTDQDIINNAKILLNKGCKNVLVSLGKNGAILITDTKVYKASLPTWDYKVENVAGAGDSMISGFITKYLQTNDYVQALKFSLICGSATAFSPKIASKELIDELSIYLDKIEVKEIE
ncbi:1-phosphofructokinase family hexose kinase [Mycoplasma feriruminatoris]|uniref:1-phosphofructokinase family hexose kinase n=1 Tax=Mycoplasma feriruminatoris TaxID=1179777 RepID=UPI0002A51B4F|nr:1-phosphofructokinase family hexose kinase [Mycoplasma feriruminatoris]UKS53959.1 hexose kinase, 1-phosphofructokinase familyprotein [Mycoplasma feriruminatoris]VZK65146.1 Tagatose-6-phosphate kinase [Mycoplasma feriruminatoris]VZR75292.1 Tagatose-6-phosphate kinase [Mycoplasma feriruminatoris]VZR97420.1 Tagatose-6-phosphate kinase [Mycoplasma feriruminatoris]